MGLLMELAMNDKQILYGFTYGRWVQRKNDVNFDWEFV
jgi:hypothetical protein